MLRPTQAADRPDSFHELAAIDCRVLADRLGLKRHGKKHRCPNGACAERRSSPALGFRPDGLGWQCWRCNVKGDAPGLAAWVLLGTVKPDTTGWRHVLDECGRRGLCASASSRTRWNSRPVAAAPRPTRRPPRRPPIDEVMDLWEAGIAMADSVEARRWLQGDPSLGLKPRRYASAERATDLDLVRVLPASTRCPRWARFLRRPWTTQGYRLLALMFDANGKVASIHAGQLEDRTRLLPNNGKPWPPCVSPAGFEISGLAMACPLTRLLLSRQPLGNGDPAADLVREVGLVVVEGLADWLTICTETSPDNENTPAVIGIISGSWSDELAGRVPDDTPVIIATDSDGQGDAYVRPIVASLEGRCRLWRWRPPEEAAT